MNNIRTHVLVCTGGGCIASGALEVCAALREQIERHNLAGEIKVIESGCLGPCAVGPVAAIYPDGVFLSGHPAGRRRRKSSKSTCSRAAS